MALVLGEVAEGMRVIQTCCTESHVKPILADRIGHVHYGQANPLLGLQATLYGQDQVGALVTLSYSRLIRASADRITALIAPALWAALRCV